MKIAELQKLLLEEVAAKISQFGFDPKIREQSFYRKIPIGRQAFHISFIKHSKDFDVTGDVAIRVDALEELLNTARSNLKKSERANTFTVGAELGNIAQGQPTRFTVFSEADVGNVATSVVEYFKQVGIPFLENLSDAEYILECLSKNDSFAWLLSPFHGKRWKSVVGLAHILGKTDRINALMEQGESFLKLRNDTEVVGFRKLSDEITRRGGRTQGPAANLVRG